MMFIRNIMCRDFLMQTVNGFQLCIILMVVKTHCFDFQFMLGWIKTSRRYFCKQSCFWHKLIGIAHLKLGFGSSRSTLSRWFSTINLATTFEKGQFKQALFW